jgi:dipeptidyl-peptidase-4
MRVAAVFLVGLGLSACVEHTRPSSGGTLTTVVAKDGNAPANADERPAMKPFADKKWLEAYALTRRFRLGAPEKATPTPDGKSVLFLRSRGRDPKQSLFELDLQSGMAREVVTADALVGGAETISAAEKARRERQRVIARGLASFELSDDGARIVTSVSGRIFVIDRANGQSRELKVAGPVLDPRFSPDAKQIAYVRNGDLYAAGTDGAPELALTKGGSDALTHGLAEFVAQEELARSRGYWFSPDSARVVYEEADTSKVETLTIPDLAHPENKPYESAYPRPGKANASVKLGIVSARGGPTTWIEWDRERLPYVATVTWSKGAPLTIYVLGRDQKHGELLAVDPASGKTTVLVREHDAAWVNVDPSVPRWTSDGSQFVWSTERNGAWQLELRDAKGELVRALTRKEHGYRRVADLDSASASVVIEASEEPTDAGVLRVPLGGGEPTRLAGAPSEMIGAAFANNHDVFISRHATRTAMPRWEARSVSGARPPIELPSLVETPPAIPQIEYAEIGADHTRVAIVRPRSFVAGAKHAVIDAAYGGPSVTVVASDASTQLLTQWMADATGAIVVSIDARGTPHRDRAWERALSGHLSDVPVDGHVAALGALGARYPEMDKARVGVFGWSFGGTFSAFAALTHPEIYKAAVVGAPVTDWRDYDTCYTERYLGVPGATSAAYDASSVVARAAKSSSSRPMLLVHGTADDNVYFMNTLKLADALERAGRPFELFPIAGVTHMLVEPPMIQAVWTRAAEFLRAHLATSR